MKPMVCLTKGADSSMYDKIMIATDGSENARLAVEHAAELAVLAGSREAIVVHICTSCSVDLDPDEKNLEASKAIVREAADVIKQAGLQATGRVETGYAPESVANAIIELAESEAVDLLVLGSRGLSEFKGILMGSVSSKVIQKVKCPVLVIKEVPD